MIIFKIKNINPISKFLLISLIIFSIQECPRDKPILKYNNCTSDYCTPEEFQSQICVISNNIIQTQWLNAMHVTDFDYTTQISSTMSDDGLIFITSQEQKGINNKYFFGFDQKGQGIFYNKTSNNYYTFQKMELPENKFSTNEKYIKIDDKGYLISAPVDDHIFLYDYTENSYSEFLLNTPSLYSDSIIQFSDKDDIFFTNYIHCNDTDHKICHTKLLVFYLDEFDYDIDEITSVDIPTKYGAQIKCLANEEYYVQCMQQIKSSKNENVTQRVINLYDHITLDIDFSFVIEENDYTDKHFIESMIKLKKNVYVMVYNFGKNQIKVLIKNVVYYEKVDEIGNVIGDGFIFDNFVAVTNSVVLNDDSYYSFENSNSDQNSVAKISDNQFAIFLVDNSNYKNSKLVIYILNIFNLNRNINARRYSINFGLYGHKITDKIRGFYINDFLGISLGISELKSLDNIKSGFIVFGYMNSTNQKSVDTNLIKNNTNSTIKLKNYINIIENNLFGYEYLGIKILSLPEEEKSGTFYYKDQKININDTLDFESTIKFVLNKNYEPGTYSIIFAGVVQEPEFSRMNSIAEKIEYFPKIDEKNDEQREYKPKILIGKEVDYKFKLGDCFENCQTCSALSGDINYQKCRKCKSGYYFVQNTRNCFKQLDKYYLNKTLEIFIPCHENCESCNGSPLNFLQMNCKSCDTKNKYYLYDSTNCLKCPKYVNYLQTECIEKIPNGYYLDNLQKRTISKCHPLCETCDTGPYHDENGKIIFMNCLTCIYKIGNKKIINGNCPDKDEYIEYEEEEESEIIDYKCPVEKPIYKDEECVLDYCDDVDYVDGTCVISNFFIKTQWVNNFHVFDDDYASHLSVDINDKGDVLISAQEDYNPNHKYFFGFDKNGTGIFYNKSTDTYSSFKKYEMKSGQFAEKMIFVKTGDGKEYFMSAPNGNYMYIFDYNENKYSAISLSPTSKKTDKLFKINGYLYFYFTAYTYCRNETFLDNCYIEMKMYELNSYNKISYLDDLYLENTIPIEYDTKVTCLSNDQNLIQCMYRTLDEYTNSYKRELHFFYPESLEMDSSLYLEMYDYNGNIIFDDMIRLKKDVYIFAYNSDEEIIQVVIQTLNYDKKASQKYTLSNYISDLKSIFVNEDKKYSFEGGSYERNNLLRINDDKFAMFLKENTGKPNSNLLILIFNIYTEESNNNKILIVKHYIINFSLHNMFISGTIRGYYLNDFIGVAIGLTLNTENYLNIESGFMTFGYVNGTEINTIDTNLNYNNTDSIIEIKDFIGKIENNLFGYNFIGVKIISLPDETNSGYFINNKTKEKIKENDFIKVNTTLRFILNNNYKDGTYSIQFAPAVKELEYEEMIKFTRNIEVYPKTLDKSLEKQYYSPKILLGKLINYRFRINHCYPSCHTCSKNSNNENEQYCLECNPGYYFVENTQNCYIEKENYYLNNNTKLLEKCNSNCLSCNGLPLNDLQMNCKKCNENFTLYESTSCLNCPKYVNYIQTECIEKIPNGYYLEDENIGTLGKCHYLCKKCSKGPFFDFLNDKFYMNCDKCLYKVEGWESEISGNCPNENEGEYEEEEEENYDEVCERSQPILMDDICKFVFCDEKQFDEKKCIIANKYAKIQWINSFNNFGPDSVSYLCADNNENGDLFILAQKESSSKINKYILGIKKDGHGYYYDDFHESFYYQIQFTLNMGEYLDDIKYIKVLNNEYIISTQKNDVFYYVDLNSTMLSSVNLNITAYKTDKFFKLNGNDDIYFSDIMKCDDNKEGTGCKLNLRNYNLNNFKFDVVSEIQEEIVVNAQNQINCFQNNLNYIQCVYTEKNSIYSQNKHILAIFDSKTLKTVEKFTLEESFYILAFFDSMVKFKNNVSIIAYSSNPNEIKVLLKELYSENNKLLLKDYISEIPYMLVGDSSKYDFDDLQPEQNCLFKISDKKFAIIVKDYFEKFEYSNFASNLVIYIFSLFDNDQKINIRSYEINFALYDIYISGKVRAYTLNNFFGITIDLTTPSSTYSNRASYLTFGYVNTTEDVNHDEGTIDLIIDDDSIVLRDRIGDVENNLFGYKFLGVKMLSLPPEKVGYFANRKKNDEKVFLNQILDINAELDFWKSKTAPIGIYSLSFVAVLQEPEYELMNNLSLSLQTYPKIENNDEFIGEEFFYKPEILYGKIFNYSFEIFKKGVPDENEEEEEEEFDPWEEEEEGEKDLCPRDKPILKNKECLSIYCKEYDYDLDRCIIANKYIETQWLNNFHLFDEKQASYIACDVNEKGEVFLFAQREVEKSVNKYLIAFDINGTGLFYNQVNEKNFCFKSFNFPSPGFADNINYIEVSNEGNLMTSFAGDVSYLIDYYKQDILSKKSNVTSKNCDNVYKLKGEKNMFFTDFIYCDNEYIIDNCSVYFRKLNITKKNIEIYLDNYKIINVHSKTKLKCLQNEENYIRCLYSIYMDGTYTKLLSIIDTSNFNIVKSFILLNNTDTIFPFDDMIQLHENLTILAHSINRNIIQVLFKKITILNENENLKVYYEDFIKDIPSIILNEDYFYKFEGCDPSKNSMTKISNTKFAIIVNDYQNSGGFENLNTDLVLFIFSIYNKNKYINVRHYPINFNLYNIFVDGEVRGYNLGDYFGLLLELTTPDSSFIGRAAFITFGFCNTTEETSVYENTKYLIEDENSIKLSSYIKNIENNLFGYEFLGIKILELPPENCGYFINIKNGNAKIEKDQIINKDSELKFIENDNAVKGTYHIIFAAAVEEPGYNKMNKFSTKVETYPKNEKVISEGHFYKQKILIGKQYKYSFNLGEIKKTCFKNCETCSEYSENSNDQKCNKCKNGFYFKYATKNCFNEILSNYYLDTKLQMFMPCYKNCYKCITQEVNDTKMNCLSCNYGFKYYETSLNCLNCPRYVNHLQTECIDNIPTGYFLKDTYLGTIEKCYSLCKTCKGVEFFDSKGLHMNCLTCVYTNSKYKSDIEGNCPYMDEEKTKENKSYFSVILGISIAALVILLVVVIIVLNKKFSTDKKNELEPLDSDYKNIHGNVKMEEDQSLGI